MKEYKFDDLFRKDSEYIDRSMVIYSGHHFYSFEAISHSYLEAVSRILGPLFEKYKEGCSLNDDELAHPVVFLLRHALESSLKKLLNQVD